MKPPEFIIHGTSSEKDAKKIENEGFEALEGRATVSCDLIYAFEWATKKERRKGSKSKSKVSDGEKGRMVVMKVPEDKSVDYATQTEIEVNQDTKEVTGYSEKYIAGRRQYGIYASDTNRELFRENRENMAKFQKDKNEYLENSGLKPADIASKEDLQVAIKNFDINKQIEILEKNEEFEKRRNKLFKITEPAIKIAQENILMSLVPTVELGEKLDQLSHKITDLEKVDLENFTIELSKIIEDNKENFLASGLDVREVVGNLLVSTMETEVVNMIRGFSMDVKRVQGYKIYNGKDEVKEKDVDKVQLKQKLEKILLTVEGDNFDIGLENLNRYIRVNAKKLLKELKSIV